MATATLTPRNADAADHGTVCPICQTAICGREEIGPCPGCRTPFHVACWDENGGCGTYGCAYTPESVGEPAASTRSFWGQEEKDCPACGRRIKVAALRCRHCGRVFSGAAQAAPAPARQRTAAVLFATGIFPPTAPVALVVGGVWLLLRWPVVRRLPGPYRVLAIVGLVAAAISTAIVLAATLTHLTSLPEAPE